MRHRIFLSLAALSLTLGLAAPGPASTTESAATAPEAWQTVCYYVYEPMWIPDRGWQLVYAKRCINHVVLAPDAARRDGIA
jgi:hypothetical protein